MRLLGFLFLFVSVFVFISVSKNVHETLPQLIADASVRSAVERCVADGVLTLVGGIFAVVLAFWCLNEAQEKELRADIRTEVFWLDKRVGELEAKLAPKSMLPSPPPPTT